MAERFRLGILADRSAVPDASAWKADGRGLPNANVHMMIQRRETAAGIGTKISAHSFRATASQRTCRTVESSKSRSRWLATGRPELPATITEGKTPWHLMEWREVLIEGGSAP